MTIEFCYLVFITIDYYTISNFIVPRFLVKKKYFFLIITTTTTILVSSLLRALIALQMNVNFFHIHSVDLGTLYTNSVINISLWVLIIVLGKMIIDSKQTQQRVVLLEKERVKNELDFLKAQINPHALFNSLNTIYGHIDKNNQLARNTLLKFSELLRYQLYDCADEKVNLEKEIAYLKNYIAFQRLRKDDQLTVSIKIENIEPDLNIVPLLLVVLIENTFKFVSNFSDKENRISIDISTKNGILYSSFTNTKEYQDTSIMKEYNGIGIVNLKRRLELSYSSKYEFATKNNDNLYETTLNINLL
jgi:two-component system LytT family sensor kinase